MANEQHQDSHHHSTGSKNVGQPPGSPSSNRQQRARSLSPVAAPKETTAAGKRAAASHATKQSVAVRRQPSTPPAPAVQPAGSSSGQSKSRVSSSSTKEPQQRGASKRRSLDLMNLNRLIRDGRKTPDHYRRRIHAAATPSQLSLKSVSEVYQLAESSFANIDQVYEYRGYKKHQKIDEGAFGVVSTATRLSDRLRVAVKEIDLSRKRAKRIEEMKRELFVLQKIESPLVVQLIEHFIAGDTLVIVMEYCQGSNLTNYLKYHNIYEQEASSLFRQMAASLKVLHRAGIAHRDVKLNNFLLNAERNHVKISDFGLSIVSYRRDQGVAYSKTYCGTEPYMAPEILRRNTMGMRSYNPIQADVWSLGICLFAMLTRTFPFKMNLTQGGLHKAQHARRWRFPRSLQESLSDELCDLVWHMLDPEPQRRITIVGVLSHPWLNQTQEPLRLTTGE